MNDTVKISNDQRLVTLTEEAYRILKEENERLKQSELKRNITIVSDIRFNAYFNDYGGGQGYWANNDSIVHRVDWYRSIPADQETWLSNQIKSDLEEASKNAENASKELEVKLKELRAGEINVRTEREQICIALAKIPWFLRFLIK